MTHSTAARRNGFTIVELLIIVIVIGILASVTMVGWGSWQQNVAKKSIESDVKQAYAAMEDAKNFGTNGYPTALPASFKPSSGITLKYVSGNASGYCLEGVNPKYPTTVFYVDSVAKTSQPGNCSGEFAVGTPSPSVSAPTESSLTISWGNVASATKYTVKYGTSSPSTAASCTSSPCVLSGLAASTAYKVNVTASSTYDTATSATITGTTAAPPAPTLAAPTNPSITAMSATDTYGTMTVAGGTCSVGTIEYQMLLYGSSSSSAPTADWSTATWSTSTYKKLTNAYPASSGIYYHAFVRGRCTDGTQFSSPGTSVYKSAYYMGTGPA